MLRQFVRSTRAVSLTCAAGLIMAGCPCIPGTGFVYFPDAAMESAVRASLHQPFGCLLGQDVRQARVIDASGLGISNLEGMSACTNVTDLDLSDNEIRSIRELANLQSLVSLDLKNNRIERIEEIAGMFFLRNLDLSGDSNDIRDFTPLSANALNGGLGDGAVVTLSTEWTVNGDGEFFSDFADDYNVLINEGVTVIFAENNGSEGK